MNQQKIRLHISETVDCPLYKTGDVFVISGIAVVMANNEKGDSLVTTTVVKGPENRTNCRILGADLNRLIIEHERADLIPEGVVMCGGCTGSAILLLSQDERLAGDEAVSNGTDDSASMLLLLQQFPFFRNIDRYDLKNVVRSFNQRKYNKNEIVIRKGDRGDNFYVVISGSVNVLNEAGLPVARLGPGEVFGEMSLLSDESVSATVQAGEACELMYAANREFKKILNSYPLLQNYFTRLMARRLSDSNRRRGMDLASVMTGRLEDFPPEALFQSLHLANKTGILTITQLPEGNARFSMRQGALIKAGYKGKKGKAAFYEILKEEKGMYKFTPGLPPEDFDAPEIGYFMKLLMAGLQKVEKKGARRKIKE